MQGKLGVMAKKKWDFDTEFSGVFELDGVRR